MASDSSPPPSVPPPASQSLRPAEEHQPRSSALAPSPAGFIFMCSGATKPDCYRHRVLGLPRGRLDAVSRIKRGAALFLYDTDIKHLHGPYRADSDGGLDLVPYAFQGRFPAQVKFEMEGDFIPLPESSLRRAIKENYVKWKFSPELNSTQVEKLRALFQPIALHQESAPSHYVANRPPVPGVYLPPSSSHPAQTPAYAHYPTAYVPPPSAHLVPPESYAPPCSYLAPPTAQPTTNAYPVTTGYGYQAGYEAYGPMPSTYKYAQVPPSCSLYTQYSMSTHVLAPVYSTAPQYAVYQNDPYQHGNATSHYQQSTSERAAYDAGHGTVVSNTELVRRYGFTPSGLTDQNAHISEMDESQLAVTYTTHAAGSSAHGASSVNYAYAAPATSYTDASLATSQVIPVSPQAVYVAAAASAYQ